MWLSSATAAVAYLHVGAVYPDLLGRDSQVASAGLKPIGSDGVPLPGARQTYLQVPTHEDQGTSTARVATDSEAVRPAGGSPRQDPGRRVLHPAVSPLLYRMTILLVLAWSNVALMGGLLAQATLFYQAIKGAGRIRALINKAHVAAIRH